MSETTAQTIGSRLEAGSPEKGSNSAVQATWLWVALAVAALVAIFSRGFFLYTAFAIGLILGTSYALVAASLLGLRIERRLTSSEIEWGETCDAELTLRNGKDWPALWLTWQERFEPGLDVEGATSAFPSLRPGQPVILEYRLHPLRRGLFRIGPALVEASGPLGLLRRFLVDSEPRFLTVYPKSVTLAQSWPLGHRPVHEMPRRHSLTEDPSRFRGVRQYRPGDPLRRIHWRATARSGDLQVKEFQPSVLDGMLLALEMSASVHGPRDQKLPETGDPTEELMMTAASSIAELVLSGDQSVGLLANGADAAERYAESWSGGVFRELDEALEQGRLSHRPGVFRPVEVTPAKSHWQLTQIRGALARLTPADGPNLARALRIELPRLPRSLVLAVITPRLDSELAMTLGALRRSGVESLVLVVGEEAGKPQPELSKSTPVWKIRSEADLLPMATQSL